MADQGCEFEFDLDQKTESLRQLVPEWRPEHAAGTARAQDGGDGIVRTDTSYKEIETLPAEQIISQILTIERRPIGRLVEYNPFLGLSTERADLALQALDAHNASGDEFQALILANLPSNRAKRKGRVRLFGVYCQLSVAFIG